MRKVNKYQTTAPKASLSPSHRPIMPFKLQRGTAPTRLCSKAGVVYFSLLEEAWWRPGGGRALAASGKKSSSSKPSPAFSDTVNCCERRRGQSKRALRPSLLPTVLQTLRQLLMRTMGCPMDEAGWQTEDMFRFYKGANVDGVSVLIWKAVLEDIHNSVGGSHAVTDYTRVVVEVAQYAYRYNDGHVAAFVASLRIVLPTRPLTILNLFPLLLRRTTYRVDDVFRVEVHTVDSPSAFHAFQASVDPVAAVYGIRTAVVHRSTPSLSRMC
ncbi:hypothetical protein BC835DRAFT_1305869 [Cytidiella melzeri]|nr:hypothetical protein BC835DRAFT_1305869 [Cytidiella melzeri]